jgi:hypothetical protein
MLAQSVNDRRRFKQGDRVEMRGFDPSVRKCRLGTVELVKTFSGKSVYPDPAKAMVFVKWDCEEDDEPLSIGVFKSTVEKIRQSRARIEIAQAERDDAERLYNMRKRRG